MRASRVLTRRRDFEGFLNHGRRSFDEIVARDPRHPERKAIYGFAVTPGGRDGGTNRRVIEVFYGTRHLEGLIELAAGGGFPSRPRRRSISEWGATLEYQRMDNGAVLCTLSPAASENFQRRERTVFLEWISATDRLKNKSMLERHWRALASYMEYSSLEGEPTWVDRLRVWWLLFTRPMIVDNKYVTASCWRAGSSIVKFALTIGLSGFLLASVQWLFASPKPS